MAYLVPQELLTVETKPVENFGTRRSDNSDARGRRKHAPICASERSDSRLQKHESSKKWLVTSEPCPAARACVRVSLLRARTVMPQPQKTQRRAAGAQKESVRVLITGGRIQRRIQE